MARGSQAGQPGAYRGDIKAAEDMEGNIRAATDRA